MQWNVVVVCLTIIYGILYLAALPTRVVEPPVVDSVGYFRCFTDGLYHVGVELNGTEAADFAECSLAFAGPDLAALETSVVSCLRSKYAAALRTEPRLIVWIHRSCKGQLVDPKVRYEYEAEYVVWFFVDMAFAIFYMLLALFSWPEAVLARWKPIAWSVCTVATRVAVAVITRIPLYDIMAVCIHLVRTGYLHILFGIVGIGFIGLGIAFYHSLPKKLHQEIDIDLNNPDRAPHRVSEVRPKWWAIFREEAAHPIGVDPGPRRRRVNPEAVFGVQPQFVDFPKVSAVIAKRLDNGDYKHIGMCFRSGDKGLSVLHNLLAGGHDLNLPNVANLVVLHNGVAVTIGEFHTFGPMKQGRTKGEVISFKWPTALDAVKSSRISVAAQPAAYLGQQVMDRNGRGDRYKMAGPNRVSYDKGEYVYHWDTFPGDSGGPLFDESGAVRAIHYGGSGRGNVGIAFVPELFPDLKDYLATPWGQVKEFAEPRVEIAQEAVCYIRHDCCEKQLARHKDLCGCPDAVFCKFSEPCPDHSVCAESVEAPKPGKGKGPAKQEPEPKGKGPAREVGLPAKQIVEEGANKQTPGYLLIQEQIQEILAIQKSFVHQLAIIREEAATHRIETKGVKNQDKSYKKGPRKEPVEEANTETDAPKKKKAPKKKVTEEAKGTKSQAQGKPAVKPEPCAYCGGAGHQAQECRKLKAAHAQKPESTGGKVQANPASKPKAKKSEEAVRPKGKPAGKVQREKSESSDEEANSSSGNEKSLRLSKQSAGGGQSKRRPAKAPLSDSN